ncbi:hypothetical protein L484_003132 [Morus notabilis]|uniref:Uncharacterized protein n=1 Tax=Morus notabilis TaxID=981085 RepID=W9QI00_9ROSA|nr:hypothetical protein L484_003132 [Morus notabilis]
MTGRPDRSTGGENSRVKNGRSVGTTPNPAISGLISTYSQEKFVNPGSNQQMEFKESKPLNFIKV